MVIRELVLPYPNFVLGAIIDPEEANENNYEISERVNDIYEYLMSFSTDRVKMTTPIAEVSGEDLQTFLVSFKSFVDSKVLNLQNQINTNKTSITALQNKDTDLQSQITANKNSITALQNKDADLQSQINTDKSNITLLQNISSGLQNQINVHKASGDHDSRYYTKSELSSWAKGGDTVIKREVFTIVSNDNLDGTFTYKDVDGVIHTGMIGEDGEQIFTLTKGFYELGTERLEAIINDTLHRTETSGGLIEISSTEVGLTPPEGNGAEITIKYYERLGVGGIANLIYGVERPTKQSMWFKVVN